MKFLFNGNLFTFFRNTISIVITNGDKYRLKFTDNPDYPFEISLVERRNYHEEILQDKFEEELRHEEV